MTPFYSLTHSLHPLTHSLTHSLTVLKGLGPRGDGAGHAGVLGLDFEEGSCTIEAISLRGMARGCLFVGDTITHVDQTPVRDALELRAALPTDGRGVRLRLRQPAVEAWIAQRPHETVTFAAWVIVRGAESGAAGGAAGGPAGGVAGAARAATGCMRVMLVGSQRVRLLKLDVLGTKLGGLHPTLVGQLSMGPAEVVEAVRALLTARGCAVCELELGGAPHDALPVGAHLASASSPRQPYASRLQPHVYPACGHVSVRLRS